MGQNANGTVTGWNAPTNGTQWGRQLSDPLQLNGGAGMDPGHFFGGKPQTPFDEVQPGDPGYTAAYDPNTMSMTKELQSLYPQYSQGFNMLRDQALNKGPSGWLTATKQANAGQAANDREHAMVENQGNTASARDQLASIGGLTSGARERVAEQGQKNYMNMSQGLTRDENLNNLNAGVTDQSNHLKQLSDLTGQEEGKMKDWESAKQTDIGNTMAETQRVNDYNMALYQRKMETWAADKQANATENSGKK